MTPTDFYATVGANIRAFRKLQHMTQKDLANKLWRSLACISKYEKGDISIDMYTLYRIADALQIPPSLLFPRSGANEAASSASFEKLPVVFQHPFLYLYSLSTKRSEVISSVIDFHPERMEATLYYAANDLRNYKECAYIMLGSIYSSEENVRIHFTNPLLKSDFIFLCFRTSDLIAGDCLGYFTALNYQHRFCSSKCFISNTPISDLDGLKTKIAIRKDEIQLLKKQNVLSL